MKKRTDLTVVGVLLILAGVASGQTLAARWFSFDGGFDAGRSQGLQLRSVLGQAFPGSSAQGNLRIASGFLADTLLQGTVTGISGKPTVPQHFALEQNYPNPFNPTSTIRYTIPEAEHVSLKLYNLLGQEVITLVDKNQPPGEYSVSLNATNLSSGVYLYRLVAGDFRDQRKLMVLK